MAQPIQVDLWLISRKGNYAWSGQIEHLAKCNFKSCPKVSKTWDMTSEGVWGDV
jgi:hypothetical protein